MKKSSLLKYFFPVLILVSCTNKEEGTIKPPSYVLTEEQYTKLLVDQALSESAGNLNISNYNGPKYDSAYAFDPLKDNHVDKAVYDSTVRFYARHQDLYKRIHENVLTALSTMQSARTKTNADSSKK